MTAGRKGMSCSRAELGRVQSGAGRLGMAGCRQYGPRAGWGGKRHGEQGAEGEICRGQGE